MSIYSLNMTASEMKSFPPADDFVAALKKIDWQVLKDRSRRDLHQIGKVICITSEFTYSLGERLTNV
jgi:hypothetical protein